MKIVVINDYGYINGGASHVVISSLNGLASLGCDVTFISAVGPSDKNSISNKVNIINFNFDDIVGNPSKFNAFLSGLWNFKSAKLVGECLRQFDKSQTVVHLHSWTKSLSSSVIKEVNDLGFKLVVTLHDYFSVCPNGGFFNYKKLEKCNLFPLSSACIVENCDSRNYPYKLWRVSRSLLQNKVAGMPSSIKYFISVSEYSEQYLLPYIGVNKIIFRVPNPISVGRMDPVNVASNDAFTFIGRLSKEKGGEIFAKAALKENVKSIFVGSGPQAYAIENSNPGSLLLGWKSPEDVNKILRNSRALVFPSLWHETQGLVIKEAASLGVPAIVSDGCAGRDSIRDMHTGLLFKAGNLNDLAKKIRLLNDDSLLAEALGKAAYDNYWKNPESELRHAEDLLNCYRSMLCES